MKNFVDPIYGNEGLREKTEKEKEYYKRMAEEAAKLPKPQPSPEERIAELESQLAAITAGYVEGVNQA